MRSSPKPSVRISIRSWGSTTRRRTSRPRRDACTKEDLPEPADSWAGALLITLDEAHRNLEKLGGVSASVYAVVDDVDEHAERAEAAGAEILLPPTDQDYGGREYTARDPEGNVWSFGEYDPYGG